MFCHLCDFRNQTARSTTERSQSSKYCHLNDTEQKSGWLRKQETVRQPAPNLTKAKQTHLQGVVFVLIVFFKNLVDGKAGEFLATAVAVELRWGTRSRLATSSTRGWHCHLKAVHVLVWNSQNWGSSLGKASGYLWEKPIPRRTLNQLTWKTWLLVSFLPTGFVPVLLLDEVFSAPPGDFDSIQVWKSML